MSSENENARLPASDENLSMLVIHSAPLERFFEVSNQLIKRFPSALMDVICPQDSFDAVASMEIYLRICYVSERKWNRGRLKFTDLLKLKRRHYDALVFVRDSANDVDRTYQDLAAYLRPDYVFVLTSDGKIGLLNPEHSKMRTIYFLPSFLILIYRFWATSLFSLAVGFAWVYARLARLKPWIFRRRSQDIG